MICAIRKWALTDAGDLAAALSNKKVQDNLRDGLPYPCTEQNAAEASWGRGIMTEAVLQTCAYVYANSDIIRIYAEPFAYNAASCRVLEKAGFQYEGTLRSSAVKNGRVLDMKMYARLRPES